MAIDEDVSLLIFKDWKKIIVVIKLIKIIWWH